LYGIKKVNGVVLEDGTFSVLVLDNYFPGTYGGSYKKITEPSEADIQFLNTIDCETYITGTTANELFIRTNQTHNVTIGDYVDLRYVSGGTVFNVYNGIHKVNKIINPWVYTCEVPSHILSTVTTPPVTDVDSMNPTIYNYRYRVMDGNPSEYYIRKFKVISAGDYTSTIYGVEFYLQQLYMSNTIWKNVAGTNFNGCEVLKQSGSDDDRICTFVFNRDVNIGSYTDNLGRPLTELYLGIIKRKDPNNFTNLISNFLGSLAYDGITTFYKTLPLPTITYPATKAPLEYFSMSQFNSGGLPVGYEYYGDLVEYSVDTLTETTLDPFQFRIGKGGDPEGYVYEPFKKLQLRYFSTDIEESDNLYGDVPTYSTFYQDRKSVG
jgi:hypothetical protein